MRTFSKKKKNYIYGTHNSLIYPGWENIKYHGGVSYEDNRFLCICHYKDLLILITVIHVLAIQQYFRLVRSRVTGRIRNGTLIVKFYVFILLFFLLMT